MDIEVVYSSDPKGRETRILALLEEAAKVRSDALAMADRVYRTQIGLYLEARKLDPPVSYSRLAAAAGVTKDAVPAALRRAKKT